MAGKPPFFNQPPGTGLLHASQINNMRVTAKQINANPNRPRQPVANRRASTAAIPTGGAPTPAAGLTLSTANPTAVGDTAAPGSTGLATDAGHAHVLGGTVGDNLSGTLPNPKVAKIHETSGPTDLTIGTITDGEFLKRVGSTLVSAVPSGGGSAPFPAWTSSAYTYAIGTPVVVSGSDGNLYRLLASSTNNDPTADGGTHWELYALRYSMTLNCGAGQRFAGSITDPAGIQQAINFIANAVGAASPATATITIQLANNGTITINTGASTTSWTSTAQLNVGTSLLYSSGTAGNSGKSCRVTAVTGPVAGVYTYTSDNGGGSTGLSSTPAAADVFTVDYGYGTNNISIQLPVIGPNVIISGSTSTTTVPIFFPTITASAGGSFAAGTYYGAITYTWSAGGATQETIHGFITTTAPTLNQKIVISSFTLPAGATGANFYLTQTLNGAVSTFKKQAAFSVTAGVAAALTVNSFSSGGASPPTVNPPAAAYPCAISVAATLSSVGLFSVQRTPGLTIENLMLYGNTSSAISRGVQGFYCTALTLINMVISAFDRNVECSQCQVNLNGIQSDYAASNAFSFLSFCMINFRGSFNIAINATSNGWSMQYASVAQTTSDFGGPTVSGANQIVAYRCGTGFGASLGSFFRITTVTSNGNQNWNNSTTYSPTSGTVGNNNAFLLVS